MSSILFSDYDEINDILCIKFNTSKNDKDLFYCTDEGAPVGIEFIKSMNTKRTVGLIIFYPKEKYEDRQKKVNLLDFDIDLKKYC